MWDILQVNLADFFSRSSVYNKIKVGIEGGVRLYTTKAWDTC